MADSMNVKYETGKSITYTTNGAPQEIDLQNIIGAKKLDGDAWSVLFVETPASEGDAEEKEAGLEIKSFQTKDLDAGFLELYSIQLVKDTLPGKNGDSRSSPNTHVVVSTLSGIGQAPSFYTGVLRPFLKELDIHENSDYTVHFTKSAQTVAEVTRSVFLEQANEGTSQRIVLLSGDGGIVDTLNAMLGGPHREAYVPPVISLIPMGTGNALAHSSGITADNTMGLSTLARGTAKDLPLFKAAFSPGARLLTDEGRKEEELAVTGDGEHVLFGAVVCSWGLHAGLVADSDTAEYRKHGIKRFAMAAKAALFPADGSEPHRYRARVVLSWKRADGSVAAEPIDRDEHGYVLTTLVSNLEKTFTISPSSAALEGHLRVVHFSHVDGMEAMRIMSLAYQDGKHVEDPAVGYEDVDGIRIEFKEPDDDGRWRRVCVDGKIVKVERDGFVEVSKWSDRVLQLTSLL